ncbi:site-specific DNA recombinase/resolvase [Janibacter hoylei PVAS-1]|uniref:Recombinase family protein n=1 Tax=Janibacter hoylei PVAS-1 TaxID=1210046 RepID=K1E048_9MICO|nr:recombinase family protein [Janibacter hoylei]EKA60396.1 site-specific DNA recombinase/resolvase [Janibacter hoylei PVAS-1]RWU84231.1 recombinase family protein [Janibacter hoylei PVAS-1]
MLIGYARVSTERQDLASQIEGLTRLGVNRERIYTDKRTGRSMKNRPGLEQAITALRPDDVLVVTKLDRLARSVPDARDLVGQIYEQGAALQLDRSVHDPADPVGKFLFNALAMVAEFEADLNRQRTLEGIAIARAQGRMRGKPPKLNERRTKKLLEEYEAGDATVAQLAEDYAVSRATVYRTVKRAKAERGSL